MIELVGIAPWQQRYLDTILAADPETLRNKRFSMPPTCDKAAIGSYSRFMWCGVDGVHTVEFSKPMNPNIWIIDDPLAPLDDARDPLWMEFMKAECWRRDPLGLVKPVVIMSRCRALWETPPKTMTSCVALEIYGAGKCC